MATDKSERPAFTQGEKRKYTRKPRIVVTPDSVDMEGLTEEQRKELLAKLIENEQVSEDLKPLFSEGVEQVASGNVIQNKHVEFMLDVLQGVERVVFPKMIARKSVFGQKVGVFQLEPQVAAKCFTFSKEQRYGKDGDEGIVQPAVEALNASLPAKIKQMIAKVGPGSIAVQRLMQAIYQQQAQAFAMQIGIYNERAKSQRSNGAAHPHPPAPPAQPQTGESSQGISSPVA